LIAVGMFASSLSDSPTVSFILGALLCAVPILIGRYFSSNLAFERLGIDYNLNDFTLGLVPLTNVLYFFSLTVLMLYLNMVAISERRWKPSSKTELLIQYLIRAICLAVVLVSAVYVLNANGTAATAQADLTSEKLYTLDLATLETLDKIKNNDQSIEIEIFVSSEIPRKYVNTKKQLLGLAKQYSEYGGSNIAVTVFEVAPNSIQGTDAQGKGIQPLADRSEEFGRIIERDVFLGAYISSPERTVSIAFFDDNDTIEYELSRSIATAYKRGSKPTLGILETDAFFGGPEVQGRRLQWAYSTTLEALKQDYDLKFIKADRISGYLSPLDLDGDDDSTEPAPPALKAPDVMLVADPASLDESAMAAFTQYIKQGHPTLILGDPLPFYWTSQAPLGLGILNAPQQERVNRNSPYAQILSSSSQPKADGGNAGPLNQALGIEWNTGQTVFNLLDPHPDFRGDWPQERLGPVWPSQYGPYEKVFNFIKNSDTATLISDSNPISGGLQELLFIYPGTIRKSETSDLTFEPLITTGTVSGLSRWNDVTQDDRQFNQYTMSLTRTVKPNQPATMDSDDHVIAAKISGTETSPVNVVFIADLDFVSDWFLCP
jgi:ABC-2 type transport system permease protein